jgi:hypothetical protein
MPTYQTQKDLDIEKSVADFLSKRWKKPVVKLPVETNMDYAFMDGEKILAVLEVKRRYHDYKQMKIWGSFFLDIAKLNGAINFIENHNARFVYAILLNDVLLIYTIKNKEDIAGMRLRNKGRKDRQNIDDIKPCIEIPIELFKRIDFYAETIPTGSA